MTAPAPALAPAAEPARHRIEMVLVVNDIDQHDGIGQRCQVTLAGLFRILIQAAGGKRPAEPFDLEEVRHGRGVSLDCEAWIRRGTRSACHLM